PAEGRGIASRAADWRSAVGSVGVTHAITGFGKARSAFLQQVDTEHRGRYHRSCFGAQ
ncbi:hypothetical protein CHARACLAT_025423, partial [Characodon lateralis]|nr:hypothetical protein [Characodon lateralis]